MHRQLANHMKQEMKKKKQKKARKETCPTKGTFGAIHVKQRKKKKNKKRRSTGRRVLFIEPGVLLASPYRYVSTEAECTRIRQRLVPYS